VEGNLNIGEKIHGKIDWDRRYTFMKHHTGTHIINGALRKLLGEHIWQAGSQIGMTEARFDFSHYKTISKKEKNEIENLANQLINQEIIVEKKVLDRNIAEHSFGFRLYQGGVPQGETIRVINIPGIDVEACGGVHLNNIKEVEKIRIIKMERIQDGVNRIIFAAGKMVDKYQREEYELYNNLLNILNSVYEIKEENEISDQLKAASQIFSVPFDNLEKTIKRFLNETGKIDKTEVNNFKDACKDLFEQWKKYRKNKKKVSSDEIDHLKNKAEIIPGTSIKIITAISEYESKSIAELIIKEPDYIVHIYDGSKITSAASENIDIDISKDIAPEIGKILGGSGGGKPKLTHSGGPKKEKVNEALDTAKKMTITVLSKY
jgi:alanyl-tRNA synthetase